ncbi:hypothetical protein M231_06656 [Tremella mesenterica]|uniref:Uncharacterized protein n=1 Tax=Tremella mesenterica TaxID=5217 RepID=A0A4Q1BB82_TREME|nr:hypothetical protein M231_06656 [Tremella mesenterica]
MFEHRITIHGSRRVTLVANPNNIQPLDAEFDCYPLSVRSYFPADSEAHHVHDRSLIRDKMSLSANALYTAIKHHTSSHSEDWANSDLKIIAHNNENSDEGEEVCVSDQDLCGVAHVVRPKDLTDIETWLLGRHFIGRFIASRVKDMWNIKHLKFTSRPQPSPLDTAETEMNALMLRNSVVLSLLRDGTIQQESLRTYLTTSLQMLATPVEDTGNAVPHDNATDALTHDTTNDVKPVADDDNTSTAPVMSTSDFLHMESDILADTITRGRVNDQGTITTYPIGGETSSHADEVVPMEITWHLHLITDEKSARRLPPQLVKMLGYHCETFLIPRPESDHDTTRMANSPSQSFTEGVARLAFQAVEAMERGLPNLKLPGEPDLIDDGYISSCQVS